MQEFYDKKTLFEYAKKSIGIPFRTIDINNRLSSVKGGIGQVMEEGYFGYKINNKSEADFKHLNVELKVTPFKKHNDKISAKERLVLNIINYMKEHALTFETSSFWQKNQSILMMFYEHMSDVPRYDWSISETILYEFPEEDLIIIKNDWETIVNKIRQGKAEELSEGMTIYLGACTKGATSESSYREQPFSSVKAKQRAFSFKQSYMNYLLKNYVFGDKTDPKILKKITYPSSKQLIDTPQEKIVKDMSELKNTGFETYLINKFKPYYGRSQQSLIKQFNLNPTNKSVNEQIASKMLGINGKIAKSEEFIKANLSVKTIRLNRDGKSMKESMSFKHFDFIELTQQDWEESDMFKSVEESRFLFVIFQFNEHNELFFRNVQFWNMPYEDIQEVKKVWLKAKAAIQNGLILTKTIKGTESNLPKSTENPVAHVRPHAQKADDMLPLPDGRKHTKQSFWLNNSYIVSQLD